MHARSLRKGAHVPSKASGMWSSLPEGGVLGFVCVSVQAAVAEAGFMTGLEASPGVAMASYAPLLAHARAQRLEPQPHRI